MLRLSLALALAGSLCAASIVHAAPSRQVLSGQITGSSQLRIDTTYLLPDTGESMTADTAVTPADADFNTLEGYYLHFCAAGTTCKGMTYRQMGALGTYYEESKEEYSLFRYFYLTYLGSYYTSVDNARSALSNALTSTPSDLAVSPTRCTVTGVDQCWEFTINQLPAAWGDTANLIVNGVTYSFKWRIMQKSNALFEGGFAFPQDDFASNQAALSQRLDYLSSGFAALFTGSGGNPTPVTSPTSQPTPRPTSTPAPTAQPTQVSTSLHVVACFQKSGSKPSANPTCLRSARRGQKVEIEVYTVVKSAPVGSAATVKMTIKRASKTVRNESGSFTTDANATIYPLGDTWKVPKKKGSYRIHATTTMNGVTAADDKTLKVK